MKVEEVLAVAVGNLRQGCGFSVSGEEGPIKPLASLAYFKNISNLPKDLYFPVFLTHGSSKTSKKTWELWVTQAMANRGQCKWRRRSSRVNMARGNPLHQFMNRKLNMHLLLLKPIKEQNVLKLFCDTYHLHANSMWSFLGLGASLCGGLVYRRLG